MTVLAGGVNGSVFKPVKGAANGQNRTEWQNRSAICILSRSNNRESINPPLPSPSRLCPPVFRRLQLRRSSFFFPPREQSKVAAVVLCCGVLFEFVARRQKRESVRVRAAVASRVPTIALIGYASSIIPIYISFEKFLPQSHFGLARPGQARPKRNFGLSATTQPRN